MALAVSGAEHARVATGPLRMAEHVAGRITAVADAIAEYPLDADTHEGVLRLIGVEPDRVRTGAVLYSAECGARVH
ncbi:hypothetical protein ACQP1W_17435 [Spirillospora sp. CA-255316]